MSKDKTQHGQSKAERYKWTMADVSSPGETLMINKHKLNIDHRYQRRAVDTKVLRMAREFSWVAFGALTVSRRGDQMYVVDGQHRLEAALRRDDVSDVPCVVYSLNDAHQEAQGFLDLNGNRKPVTSLEKFKGEIFAGNEIPVFVNKLIAESGRTVGCASSSGCVACVGILQKLASEDRSKLAALWPVICKLCDGKPIQNEIVKGAWYAEKSMPEGCTFTSGRWMGRLLEAGYDNVLAGIRKATAYHGSMSPRFAAEGIVNACNHKLRNTLVLVNKSQASDSL